MKDIIKAIKAFFQFRKILKKGNMNLETIRKIWVILGSLVAGFAFVPDWIKNLFSDSGTSAVFGVVAAVLALLQFLPFRTGENKPAELKADKPNKLIYAINPFAKA